MNTNVVQITQQIEFLNRRHLEELHLFVEFLLSKQQKEVKSIPKRKKSVMLLADIQPIAMPVSDYIIQRDDIYEDRI
jgi:hypothetical protein